MSSAAKRRKLDKDHTHQSRHKTAGSIKNGTDYGNTASLPPKAPAKAPTEDHGHRGIMQEHSDSAASKNIANTLAASFESLDLRPELLDALKALHFDKPTPIQAQSIPHALAGRDIIGLAETGSGKTAAFALPILQDLLANEQKLFALVLAPTRELAYQTSQQFAALGSSIRVRTAVIVGGMSEVEQAISLAKGPHIVVATPGRLLYHLENTKGFNLRNLKYLVMDEADRLLDLNFGKEIDKILRSLPVDSRHTYLFSATMSAGVAALQRASLRKPVKVSISSEAVARAKNGDVPEGAVSKNQMNNSNQPKHTTVSTLRQYFLLRPYATKDLNTIYLLTTPGHHAGHSSIIFCRTIHEVARLTHLLRALGVGAIPLHGDLSQSARMTALTKFKGHSRDVLVATDVAARGLDIPSVDLVLNYDLPGDDTTYIHRVGRTARAGKSGVAISLVSQYDVEVWLRIEKSLGKRIEQVPGVDDGEVKVLAERVGEAQRAAIRAVKDEEEKKGKGRRGNQRTKRSRGNRDREEEE